MLLERYFKVLFFPIHIIISNKKKVTLQNISMLHESVFELTSESIRKINTTITNEQNQHCP